MATREERCGLNAYVERLLQDNIDHLRERLCAVPGLQIVTPEARSKRAGILSFSIAGHDSERIYRALMSRGVICASRGGYVRFSPHFHTRPQTLASAVEELVAVCNAS